MPYFDEEFWARGGRLLCKPDLACLRVDADLYGILLLQLKEQLDYIKRIQARETRYKELDQEKIQKQVHTELVESTTAENAACSLTNQDNLAVRWLVLHSVTYDVRNDAETISGVDVGHDSDPEEIYQAISKMTDAQFSGLIRVALSGIPDSKIPTSITGYFLKQVAEGAGVDIARIEKKQSEKAQTRVDNQEVKIALYKKRIKRHQVKSVA